MSRAALLIASPGISGSSGYLPGTLKDIERFGNFLRSPVGGTWERGEITALTNPSRSEVLTARDRLKTVDFGLVIFTGHGCHVGSSTHVEVCPDVQMDSAELVIGAPKQVAIFDCCRKLVSVTLLEKAMLAAMDRAGTPLNPASCRRYYDKRIAECSNGVTSMFACSKDEVSSETSSGGIYSNALIDGANNWFNSSTVDTTKNFEILSVVDIHERSKILVQQSSGNRQNPDIVYPRTGPNFPFAVIA